MEREKGTGIEGLEKVLKSGGLGAGKGMWEVEHEGEGEMKCGGKGWNLVSLRGCSFGLAAW